MEKGIRILVKPPAGAEAILSGEALAFVEKLHREFQPTRRALLERRAKRQAEFDAGALPQFLAETQSSGPAPGRSPIPPRTSRSGGSRSPARASARCVCSERFVEFLTLPAYGYLE